MEIIDDEYSSDSTISYKTNYSNDSSFIFNNDELMLIQKPEDIRPKFLSITSTLNLSSNLNLKNISQKLKFSEYEQNFSNKSLLILKKKNIVINIYPNGKIILSGAKSEKEAKKYCYKIVKNFKKISTREIYKEFKVQNIVANYVINFRINLEILYKEINNLIDKGKDICNYVVENYPMVILYISLNEQKINATFFETGKIVISGAKSLNDIENIFKRIYPLVNKARIFLE